MINEIIVILNDIFMLYCLIKFILLLFFGILGNYFNSNYPI